MRLSELTINCAGDEMLAIASLKIGVRQFEKILACKVVLLWSVVEGIEPLLGLTELSAILFFTLRIGHCEALLFYHTSK